ncbi:MAG TPA: hypothetical protein VJM57_01330 [Thermodesulfobacteriota bacterium]|nr:hypothetical protein [Thermodesulfobacteriota bacterium]
MKKLLTLLLIVTVVGFNGCAPPVRYSVTEWFHQLKPETVAVLPVKWGTEWAGGAEGGGSGDAEVARLFRTMSAERLTSMNYRTVSMEEVDRRYPETGREGFKKMAPADVAQALGVDAVLYISITEWDPSLLATYASLEMGATFELYGRNSSKLWRAEYESKESDIRLDRESMELAVLKAYEPRIERFVRAVFSTLPPAEQRTHKKRFFEWLP